MLSKRHELVSSMVVGLVLMAIAVDAKAQKPAENFAERVKRCEQSLACIEKSLQVRERLIAVKAVGTQSADSKLKRQSLAENARQMTGHIPAMVATTAQPPAILLGRNNRILTASL